MKCFLFSYSLEKFIQDWQFFFLKILVYLQMKLSEIVIFVGGYFSLFIKIFIENTKFPFFPCVHYYKLNFSGNLSIPLTVLNVLTKSYLCYLLMMFYVWTICNNVIFSIPNISYLGLLYFLLSDPHQEFINFISLCK